MWPQRASGHGPMRAPWREAFVLWAGVPRSLQGTPWSLCLLQTPGTSGSCCSFSTAQEETSLLPRRDQSVVCGWWRVHNWAHVGESLLSFSSCCVEVVSGAPWSSVPPV